MIPVAKPLLGREEVRAARDVILSGWVTQGPKVREFEKAFATYVGAKYACAVSSCTTALHLALLAVGVRPGDVVITVSHSFIATANAVRHCGAEPVFVDIDPDTYNMSAAALEMFLVRDCERVRGRLYYKKVDRLSGGKSPLRYWPAPARGRAGRRPGRVAAVMPVHQMGMPCDLRAILDISRKFHLPVIEDAACAIGSEIRLKRTWEKIGKPHGDIACFSFHPRKLVTTGDGGMLTTARRDYDRLFRLLRHHGMSISDVQRDRAKRITFEEYPVTGFNYRLTDIQAGIGLEQLKKLPSMISERRRLAALYAEGLKEIPWLRIPHEPAECRSNWQSYPIKILKGAPLGRTQIMERMLALGISTRRGIMNAHQEPAYRSRREPLPRSEEARDQVILLPFYNRLKKADLFKIVEFLRHL
jgi:dTDP-4-amino-4,6-dideoxygalactose transaminase